jgi:hypothetical protein
MSKKWWIIAIIIMALLGDVLSFTFGHFVASRQCDSFKLECFKVVDEAINAVRDADNFLKEYDCVKKDPNPRGEKNDGGKEFRKGEMRI